MLSLEPCVCGDRKGFDRCCGPILTRREVANTAEELMRSRFTAFAVANVDYLLYSWHPTTRPTSLELSPLRHWESLEIVETTDGEPTDDTGSVRFVAHYSEGMIAGSIDELSQFGRYQGRWVYVRGIQRLV